MKKRIAVLFCRADSAYKDRDACDVYDAQRDARTFRGAMPVIAHPPCRCWGALSHMAHRSTPNRDAVVLAEKQLAIWACGQVRKCGGVLEHPAKSKLFKTHLPDVGQFLDDFGGYTIEVNQWDFGHVASKPTKLYICGLPFDMLPDLPPRREGTPSKSITGQVGDTRTCTQHEREYTPEPLIDWLIEVCDRIAEGNQ